VCLKRVVQTSVIQVDDDTTFIIEPLPNELAISPVASSTSGTYHIMYKEGIYMSANDPLYCLWKSSKAACLIYNYINYIILYIILIILIEIELNYKLPCMVEL